MSNQELAAHSPCHSEGVTRKKNATKSATVQKLLSRNKGATLPELIEATNWQPHTTRAFLTGLRKKGMVVVREARTNGDTCWRVDC